MANFLTSLGAALQGQQDYQTWATQQEAAKLRIEAEKENLAQIKENAEEAKAERKRKPQVAQGFLDSLAQLGLPGLPPAAPSAPPPAPGQASVPMVQPNVQYGQRQIAPPPPIQPQVQPPMPPMAPQGLPQAAQGPQGGMQAQPAIPPYRTVQGAPNAPQPGMQGIGPPPVQQQAAPPMRPNSWTLADAAQFIKSKGITDPVTSLEILDRLQPVLDNQAKQEAAMLKIQLQQQQKYAELLEKAREADQKSRDANRSDAERERWHRESMASIEAYRQGMLAVAQQNADTRKNAAGEGVGGSKMDEGGLEAAAWNYLLRGANPPARGGMYQATMQKVAQIAQENGMTVQELTSASADVKTKLAAKRNFEIRAQNMERAENQILSEIPLAEQAIKGLNISSIPAFQKGGLAALRALGDPRVTQLDQSLTTIFNEFEGIRTGNPGALHVSDVENARHDIENARTEDQLNAAIKGMRATMNRAKAAMEKTRSDTMKGINDSFKKEKPPENSNIPSGAVDYLKQNIKTNPGLKAQFDAKYGAGAADRILGQ